MMKPFRQPVQAMTLLLILLLAALVITSGCTSPTPPATTAPDTPVISGSSPAAAATAAPSSGGSSGQATDVRTLNALLPAAPVGWGITQQPTGSTRLDENNQPWTASSATYSPTANKDASATITFQDTAGHNVGFRKIWSTFTPSVNSDGYFRSATLHGSPAWETHSISGKSFKTWVLVNDRFMVQVSIENGTDADYNTFLSAINFAGIAALK